MALNPLQTRLVILTIQILELVTRFFRSLLAQNVIIDLTQDSEDDEPTPTQQAQLAIEHTEVEEIPSPSEAPPNPPTLYPTFPHNHANPELYNDIDSPRYEESDGEDYAPGSECGICEVHGVTDFLEYLGGTQCLDCFNESHEPRW